MKLIPFKELSVAEHADPFHDLVSRNADELTLRYMGDVAAKYGVDVRVAREQFGRAISEDAAARSGEGTTRFAIIDTDPETVAVKGLIGAATLDRGIPLRSLRLPVWPKVARAPLLRSLLSRSHPFEGPEANLSAWVDTMPEGERVPEVKPLAKAYNLARLELYEDELAWTIEPDGAMTSYARSALELADFTRRGHPLRYDVGESARVVPPQSLLYEYDRIV